MIATQWWPPRALQVAPGENRDAASQERADNHPAPGRRCHQAANAYGPIYGDTELSSNAQPVLDPVHSTKTTIQRPVRPDTPSSALADHVINASRHCGMCLPWG